MEGGTRTTRRQVLRETDEAATEIASITVSELLQAREVHSEKLDLNPLRYLDELCCSGQSGPQEFLYSLAELTTTVDFGETEMIIFEYLADALGEVLERPSLDRVIRPLTRQAPLALEGRIPEFVRSELGLRYSYRLMGIMENPPISVLSPSDWVAFRAVRIEGSTPRIRLRS
ncbi:hypothetical protein [Methanopyrus sp.]